MKKNKSQKSEVLRYLKSHKKGITRAMAWEMFGCQNLADVIYRLRREGYNIINRDVTTKNRYGHTTTYTYYVLVA